VDNVYTGAISKNLAILAPTGIWLSSQTTKALYAYLTIEDRDMSNEYQDKHLLDVTSSQEPDHQSHFDKPIVIPDYELWSEQTETRIEEKEAYYEQR
jgi:hypothetical protein